MAKIKCPKCKSKIDSAAEICPQCRTHFTQEELKERRKSENLATGCAVLLLLGFVGYCAFTPSEKEAAASKVADKPSASAKADSIAFYKKALETIKGCDIAGSSVAIAASSGDPIAMYRAAETMEGACLSTSSDIRALEIPASIGKENYDALSKAIDACESAYLNKWSAAGTIKKVLDGGGISKLAELKDTTEAMQAGTMACAAGLVSVPMTLGATQVDLGLSSK